MREHMGLYRGKRVDNGEWVEGYYVRLFDGKGNVSHRIYNGYAETDCGEFYPDWFEVDPDTVGECTGLQANGKLIFEGDIVRQHGLKWLVGYQKGTFACIDEKNEMLFAFFEQYDFYKGEYRFPDTFEIIGNINDNPELVEEMKGENNGQQSI